MAPCVVVERRWWATRSNEGVAVEYAWWSWSSVHFARMCFAFLHLIAPLCSKLNCPGAGCGWGSRGVLGVGGGVAGQAKARPKRKKHNWNCNNFLAGSSNSHPHIPKKVYGETHALEPGLINFWSTHIHMNTYPHKSTLEHLWHTHHPYTHTAAREFDSRVFREFSVSFR